MPTIGTHRRLYVNQDASYTETSVNSHLAAEAAHVALKRRQQRRRLPAAGLVPQARRRVQSRTQAQSHAAAAAPAGAALTCAASCIERLRLRRSCNRHAVRWRRRIELLNG